LHTQWLARVEYLDFKSRFPASRRQGGHEEDQRARRAAAAAGDLQYFNVLFQQKRKAAALEGRKLDYGACRQRFEAALAHVAAGRMAGVPGVTTDVVAMTFGER
jgi:hypothetical protein